MAKEYVNCAACGAPIEIRDNSRRNAQLIAKRMAERGAVCETCLTARRNAENQASKAAAEAAGLPALTGPDKQVAWAYTIRQNLLQQLPEWTTAVIARLNNFPHNVQPSDQALAELNDAIAYYVTQIAQQVDASWWIDNRDINNADCLYRHIARQLDHNEAIIMPTMASEFPRYFYRD